MNVSSSRPKVGGIMSAPHIKWSIVEQPVSVFAICFGGIFWLLMLALVLRKRISEAMLSCWDRNAFQNRFRVSDAVLFLLPQCILEAFRNCCCYSDAMPSGACVRRPVEWRWSIVKGNKRNTSALPVFCSMYLDSSWQLRFGFSLRKAKQSLIITWWNHAGPHVSSSAAFAWHIARLFFNFEKKKKKSNQLFLQRCLLLYQAISISLHIYSHRPRLP